METIAYKVEGQIVDIIGNKVFGGQVLIKDGKIDSIIEKEVSSSHYIIPGFIDSHIHIESSMLVPSEFARVAVTHGTVATVSDPHEIANVLGVKGIEFMIDNGREVPFKFYFGAPSCVPATDFESSGAKITPDILDQLLQRDDIKYLSEMMNYPGVIHKDPIVMEKIAIAKKYNKPIDGHAPGLIGEEAKKYIEAGITTDHECYTIEEALDKIKYGMKVQIREGSAARNFDALTPLLYDNDKDILFCSDDKHPDELIHGHINLLVKKAVSLGHDPIKILRIASLNPVEHYGLDVGLLQKGDDADFIIVEDLKEFNVLQTYVKGELVAEGGKSLIQSVDIKPLNVFIDNAITEKDLKIKAESDKLRIIKVIEGELVTDSFVTTPKIVNNEAVTDIDRDLLKMVVVNRYTNQPPAVAFINNMGFRRGAVALSIAHDSHNIIATGCSDEEITRAINLVIKNKGGIAIVDHNNEDTLPLPVAGLMAVDTPWNVGHKYARLNQEAINLGTHLKAPFMTLSFMSLLVIPTLKLSDKGLFDGDEFKFVSLFE
ncbi:MAG: adenine deaminase [Hyphomicrobiales bacterium]